MIAHVLFWLGIACLMAVCASAAWENLTRPRRPRRAVQHYPTTQDIGGRS